MRTVVSRKVQIFYKDQNGNYRSAILTEEPNERAKKEYGIAEIISVQPIKMVIKRTIDDEFDRKRNQIDKVVEYERRKDL